ncbi:MAG: DegV family protein [Anaerolineales bacterium]
MQVLHSNNPEAAGYLKDKIDQLFECSWLPAGPMSLVLGAHTGPSMVGVGFGDLAVFNEVP